MRKVIFFVLILLSGCTKKEKTCTEEIMKIGQSFAFRGFAIADIDTIITRRYTYDNTFSHLVSTDTIIDPAIRLDSATKSLYSSTNYSGVFTGVSDDFDMEVYLPAVGITYQLHATYPENHTLTTTDCRSRNPVQRPSGVSVKKNGVTASCEATWNDGQPIYFFIP